MKGQLLTRRYLDVDRKVIIELRGITKKNTHTLSVGPGSTHESGEPSRFCEPLGLPGHVDEPAALKDSVRDAALGIVIAQVCPATNRHPLRLGFAKGLLTHGLLVERTIATASRNGSDWKRWRGCRTRK